MKRACSVLASLPLTLMTTSQVQAESHWLVLTYGYGATVSLEKIEMTNEDQCEEQGALWMASRRITKAKYIEDYIGFECIVGK